MSSPRASMMLSVVLVSGLSLACGSGTSEQPTPTAPGLPQPACPYDPIAIVVTVDQWGDIVEQLAGGCGDVTTIIEGTSGDPHDYEPTPGDNAAFTDAELVVMNGLDYDHWAEDALDALSTRPTVVNAGEVAELTEGDNPHVWYEPRYIHLVAAQVANQLMTLRPEAAAYFSTRQTAWEAALQPYSDRIETIRTEHAGTPYAATESVFDYMARSLQFDDLTPAGYRNAVANESEPAPGDLLEFEDAFRAGRIRVLVFNTQTEGALTDQLRQVAEDADVPVVEVTETVPAGLTFIAWQLGQLDALAAALTA